MDLNDIRIFVAIIAEGGITRASRALDMSKSSVSRRLSQLEENLGVQLVQRAKTGLVCTDIGYRYYERCTRILGELSDANDMVAAAESEPSGKLRISSLIAFGETFIAGVVTEFLTHHPDVSIEVVLSDEEIDLSAGGIDVAFRLGPFADSDLIARKLGPTNPRLCAGREYVKERGIPQTVAELTDHDIVLMGHGPSEVTWRLPGIDQVEEVNVRARLRVNSLAFAMQAVLANAGIAFLPSFLCNEDVRLGRLVPILEESLTSRRSVYVVYPPQRFMPMRTRAFIDFALEKLLPPPWLTRTEPDQV